MKVQELTELLAEAAAAGAGQLTVDDSSPMAAGMDLVLSAPGGTGPGEAIQLAAVDGDTHRLTLAWPLSHGFAPDVTLSILEDSTDAAEETTLASRALAGLDPGVLELQEPDAAEGAYLRLGDGSVSEIVRIHSVAHAMSLAEPLRFTHQTGGLVTTLAEDLESGQRIMRVENALGIHPGTVLGCYPAGCP